MISFRHWRPDDAFEIQPMLKHMLETTSEQGGQLLPTARNVQVLFALGMDFSLKGEPTLVAVDAGVIVGLTLWGSFPTPVPLDTKDEVCIGFGTYVLPQLRRKRIASALRMAALEIAERKGYDVVKGTAYHDEGKLSALAVGFKPVGTEVEMRL